MEPRFLDSFLKYRGNEGKPIITLEYFFEHAEFKDLFEFAVWCNDKDPYYMYDFLDSIWFLYSDYYDETQERHKEIMDHYEYLLDSFMKERNITLKEERRLCRDTDIALLNAADYVFDLYNKDYKCSRFYFDSFSGENLWVGEVVCLLEEKVNEVFLREWEKLKQRFGFECSEWKERAMLLGVGFLNDDSLYQRYADKSYEYNGLFINEKFISDNNLISADEMCGWLEGIVNMALKDLGIRYDKEKIKCVEQFMKQEVEKELER